MIKEFRPVPLVLLAGVMLVGCALEDGKDGRDGTDGTNGRDFQVLAWVGSNETSCVMCHSGTVSEWLGTGHPGAYQSLVAAGANNSPYCLQCHTLGWDAPVTSADSTLAELSDHGTNTGGYDDYWPSRGAADDARLLALRGVQCESCHGSMGPDAYNHQPEVSLATRFENGVSLSPCATCHETQMQEWHEGAHGSYYERNPSHSVADYSEEWNSTGCWSCHSAEGFIAAFDPDHAGVSPVPGAEIDLIGCVACHDPHSAANDLQLRALNDFTVVYNLDGIATPEETFTGNGSSQLCAQCHHARRSVSQVNTQIFGGGTFRGPHESPQMDMLLGTGCYEIPGRVYQREATHQAIESPCVTCHMAVSVSHGGGVRRDHSFAATTTACTGCHANLVNFNWSNGQGEVEDMLAHVATLLETVEDSLSSTTWNAQLTPTQREAVYAYLFVKNDGSKGVHNPAYAKSLLENAIQHLLQP